MKRTPAELLQWIGPARRHDPVSHRNIVAALTAKKPKVSATFTCTETHDTLGRDTVHIKATAGGDSYRTDTVKLKEGESQALLVHPRRAVRLDRGDRPREPRSRSRSRTSTPGEEASASFRLTGSKDLVKVGSGKYTVSVTVT